MEFEKTFSLTFGDVAENHKGMQKIGHFAEKGFDVHDLNRAKLWFEEKECKCNLVNLSWFAPEEAQTRENSAYVLVVKGAVNALLNDENGADNLFEEQDVLEKDSKVKYETNIKRILVSIFYVKISISSINKSGKKSNLGSSILCMSVASNTKLSFPILSFTLSSQSMSSIFRC